MKKPKKPTWDTYLRQVRDLLTDVTKKMGQLAPAKQPRPSLTDCLRRVDALRAAGDKRWRGIVDQAEKHLGADDLQRFAQAAMELRRRWDQRMCAVIDKAMLTVGDPERRTEPVRRRSTIRVTDAARGEQPDLPTGHALELLKNEILANVREHNPDLVANMEEVDPGDAKEGWWMIEFEPGHYGPLGLQVLVYRRLGTHVCICSLGEFGDGAPP